MFSKIFLNKQNLLNNIEFLSQKGGRPICLMVKANAYGHGLEQIVQMATEDVDYFGVSNMTEGLRARQNTNKMVIVFGYCEDYQKCMQNNLSFAVFSLDQVKEIVNLSLKNNLNPRMHLCVNTGMNRYGVKTKKEFVKIIRFLQTKNITLEGFYTHFSSLTTDENYTEKQAEKFEDFKSLLPKEWNTLTHIGGGNVIYRDFDASFFRIGMQAYGYGTSEVKSVLRVESQIVDIQEVLKGEHIGYLCAYTAQRDMKIATIPLGYGDGLFRKQSNKLEVLINGKRAKNVGNICMDAFMVDVTGIKCKRGDKVIVLENALISAKEIESTEYEVLTALSKFRGERVIE